VTTIRPTRPAELTVLQEIELAAGSIFRDVGMSDIADHPVPSVEVLGAYVQAGRSWVAVDDSDRPVAFVLVTVIDGLAHIEQISVHPRVARRGIGRELIDHVDRWAADGGYAALTLTTFRNVPWNEPYYARIGFTALRPDRQGPELAELMAQEAEHGLEPAHRLAMRRAVRGEVQPNDRRR
jgi:GNAT superfamily N-acetyltransferase